MHFPGKWALSLIGLVLFAEWSRGLDLAGKSDDVMVTEGEPFEHNCEVSGGNWKYCYWKNGDAPDMSTTGNKY